jgi:hypothetical protein
VGLVPEPQPPGTARAPRGLEKFCSHKLISLTIAGGTGGPVASTRLRLYHRCQTLTQSISFRTSSGVVESAPPSQPPITCPRIRNIGELSVVSYVGQQ